MRHELLSRYLASTPAGCDAVISALGHNLTLRGMYGAPRKLCTDTVSQLCRVAEMLQPPRPLRLIAISTEGVDRPDGADPPRGRAERLVLWLLWLLLPPHADNMGVVDYLHRSVLGGRCMVAPHHSAAASQLPHRGIIQRTGRLGRRAAPEGSPRRSDLREGWRRYGGGMAVAPHSCGHTTPRS